MKRTKGPGKLHGALTIKEIASGQRAYFVGMIRGAENIRFFQEHIETNPRFETLSCTLLLELEIERRRKLLET